MATSYSRCRTNDLEARCVSTLARFGRVRLGSMEVGPKSAKLTTSAPCLVELMAKLDSAWVEMLVPACRSNPQKNLSALARGATASRTQSCKHKVSPRADQFHRHALAFNRVLGRPREAQSARSCGSRSDMASEATRWASVRAHARMQPAWYASVMHMAWRWASRCDCKCM